MRHSAAWAAVGLAVLGGCTFEGPVRLPDEDGPYEVITLRALPAGTEAEFGDLNENGQALWHEDGRAILWDDGQILEVPVGSFLGDGGEVLGTIDGTAALWRDGELTTLTGTPMGLLRDGTVYLARNDTVFTWRDGVLEATDRPAAYPGSGQPGILGPEGRIWSVEENEEATAAAERQVCGFFQDGEWHRVSFTVTCRIVMAEENGWALADVTGGNPFGVTVLGPEGFWIRDESALAYHDAVHVNAQGHAIAEDGLLVLDPDAADPLDLRVYFPGIRLGAINDDAAILAQLADEVVLLTPR